MSEILNFEFHMSEIFSIQSINLLGGKEKKGVKITNCDPIKEKK